MRPMTPTAITLHQQSCELEIAFDDGAHYRFSYEFLRVNSPSAEVRGHGRGQEVLQVGKRLVKINGVEPVGSYAMKIIFDDGHDSGLFTWQYLDNLGKNQAALWQDYLQQMDAANESREPSANPVAAHQSCGH
jgi:DUF971 family protein